MAWFSKVYLRVQSKNCGKNILFLFSFQNFFRILTENFSDFSPKNFNKFSKLPSTCPEEQFVAWNFFLKFWIVLDFLQKPLAWFSKFYLRVQSKICGRNSFFFVFFSESLSDFEQKVFQTFGQKTSRSFQNYLLRVQRNSLWLEIFFLKFWIVLDFLQKPLWWFSKFYLSVQSKICGWNSFFYFSSEFSLILSEIFSDFWPKNFKMFSKLPSTCPEEQFAAFFSKFFEPFWIFYRNLYDGSQKSIYVSRVKIAEEIVFFVFLFRISLGFWAKNFSDFWPKNFKKFSKVPSACPEEQFVAWFFFKTLTRFGFSAETLSMALKSLSTCPE